MSDIHNTSPIQNQVNNPIIHGNLVMYGERNVNRILTALPYLTEPIIGREEALQDLTTTLTAGQRVVLVNGMGGIGKTTIATAYAQQQQGQFKHIAWIEQSGDFVTDLITNTVLLRNLGLQLSAEPEADTKAILNALSNLSGPSLLVIDNADEKLAPFRDYLPKAPNWQVLITSREELAFAKIFTLDFLSEESAMELFYSHYQHDENDELLRALLATIDYHTLTIELLAKIAQECAITSITKITELLKERGLAIGRRTSVSIAHSKDERIEYLFPYIQAIFDIGDDYTDSQQQLLKCFLGLPPIPVPLDHLYLILLEHPTEETSQDDLRFDLKKLSQKGLLLHDARTVSFKMHRVIQEVLYKKYSVEEEDLTQVISRVGSMLFINEVKSNPVDKFPLATYGEHLVKSNFFHGFNSANFARLQSHLALIYIHLGRFESAVLLLEKALVLLDHDLGATYYNIAIVQSNLANTYRSLGRYEDSLKLFDSALKMAVQNLGNSHQSVASIQSNLAMVYQELGRYEEAEELFNSALLSDQQNFGDAHPLTSIKRSNLAILYKELGRYHDAVQMLQSVLFSNLKFFGESHPNVARSRSNLAAVYQDLDRYEEAEELLKLALSSDRKNFGDTHHRIAISKSNLAAIYQHLGRYELASELLESALLLNLQNFNKSHPNVTRNKSNLALVYQDLGRYAEAASLLEDALRSEFENFGKLHPSVAQIQWNLATVYISLSRIEEAVSLLKSAYHIFYRALGKDHPNTKIVEGCLKTYNVN